MNIGINRTRKHYVSMVTINWFEINEVGLPTRDKDNRYSVPVLIANVYTGQIENHTVVYDFKDHGWCLYGLSDGKSCKNYKILEPTHYCFIPSFIV